MVLYNNSQLEDDGENSKGAVHSAMLSSSDFHRILDGTQIGQVRSPGYLF